MAGYVTSERIADAIATGGGGRTAAHTYATVAEAADPWTLKARLDGAAEPVAVAAFCSASVGDRIAVTIRPDGRCIATGRRGGDAPAWDSVAGKPETFPPASHAHPEFGAAHIEAKGVSGIWRYIKFSDGTAFCVGKYKAAISIGTEYDAYHWHSNAVTVALPFEFTTGPRFFGSAGALSYVAQDTGTTANGRVGFYVVRPAQGAVNYVDLLVAGRWK